MDLRMAIIIDEKKMTMLRNIILEIARSAGLRGAVQKCHIEGKTSLYLVRISSVPPKIYLSKDSVDYLATLKPLREEEQEELLELLKERATILSRENDIDVSIFVDKLPVVMSVQRDTTDEEMIARIINDVSRMLSIRRDTVMRILKSVIGEEYVELVRAYRAVSRR